MLSAAALVALLSTLTFLAGGERYPTPPATLLAGADAPAVRPAAARTAAEAADPVRVRIPAIGVEAPVDPLVVDAAGVLPAPQSFARTGWWRHGPEPGEAGPAVIAGHVDSYRGPAVFHRLDDLDAGDEILVDRIDGSTVRFVVRAVEQHDKDSFPTAAVYGETRDARLRLITCGGEFSEAGRRYLDNVIVYATQAS